MAILKHISVKNRFYSDAVEYLTCQFDEYTNKPILDGKGRIMERENYLIDGVNCDVDSFGAECIETNRFYGKNNSVNDVKAHHYIISFEPEDDITMEQAMEFGKKWLAEFAPGHQAVVAVHPDGHNNSRNMHIHMVINSVRKFPGRKSIWHDKPCEWKQCCKHKSTGKMMYHAKKWVMDKCIRLGLGQADLLARKHKDNYWVEKRLMDKNASDGVGVTSDRELIRNTIDKILPTVNSFEQLIEYLRAIYHWTIRVTNKTVTFAMPDMKKGIRGNKLGEGYGKAELADRIRGFVAEREAKDLAMKQMEAEIEALIQSEQEKKRKQAEELKKREGGSNADLLTLSFDELSHVTVMSDVDAYIADEKGKRVKNVTFVAATEKGNQFTIALTGLAKANYQLVIPEGTFHYEKNNKEVKTQAIKEAFTIGKGGSPEDPNLKYDYSVLQMLPDVSEPVKDVALNGFMIKNIGYYDGLVANPEREVRLAVYDNNKTIRTGHFENYVDPEDPTTPTLLLVFDTPIREGELNTDLYAIVILKGTFGDTNFGKFLEDKTTTRASDCRANPRMTIAIEVDNDKATGIEHVVNSTGKNNVIYDIQGRKVKQMNRSGIYIVNGKKFIKK